MVRNTRHAQGISVCDKQQLPAGVSLSRLGRDETRQERGLPPPLAFIRRCASLSLSLGATSSLKIFSSIVQIVATGCLPNNVAHFDFLYQTIRTTDWSAAELHTNKRELILGWKSPKPNWVHSPDHCYMCIAKSLILSAHLQH